MNWIESISRTIEYIENNITEDIDINDMKYIDIINEMENTFKKANIIS